MTASTPSLMMSLGRVKWRSVRRGSELTLERPADHEGFMRLGYPAGLYYRTCAQILTTAFQAAVELSKPATLSVQVETWSKTASTFQVRWS